ncbi:MAG: hypothetical protein COB98_04770 [Flavobacteriaceae bacterium]|nr:MAG: hypothetical protein COB98_04770 [Flavobacteriaceae bacterium]
MENSTYPQSPINVPENLTKLPASYQFRAALAILAILLFFVMYFGLVVLLGYLAYYAFVYDMGSVNKLTILLKIGAIAGAVMLFVFTLKFVFKLKNHKPTNRIKLKKDDHPELWSFIDTICKETGAPRPKTIFIDPDVNAYVSYTNVWLSLLFPVKKELTLGLGLISCLNLSEFKAVVSHEFGHFAQRSMKIGSYINSANAIIHDMIFTRDSWDNLLDQWRNSDIRLSAAAWIITPMIWVIRKVLSLFYQFLNVMYSSLSREMEFNADKVAVKTSGSEAIVAALWKLDVGFEQWDITLNMGYLAAQKKMYVKNMYTHHLDVIQEAKGEQLIALGELSKDSNGINIYFTDSEISKVDMYASHPDNDKREGNAKTPFVPCEIDDRSPWILFNNQGELQQEMTALIHDKYLNKKPTHFSSDKEFSRFVQIETFNENLSEEYENTFESRFLTIEEEGELRVSGEKFKGNTKELDSLKERLKLLMAPIHDINELLIKAQQIAEGSIKENSFSFKGQQYEKKTLEEGYGKLIDERERLFQNDFKTWDLEFCSFHYVLAQKKGLQIKLLNVYKQHELISDFYKSCVETKNRILQELNDLQVREDVSEEEVSRFSDKVIMEFKGLKKEMDIFDEMTFVLLANIDTVQELKDAIIEADCFNIETGKIFENGSFEKIMNTLDSTAVHCQRVDKKSIAAILTIHKELQLNIT